MEDREILKKKNNIINILIIIVFALLMILIISYKIYFSEKREREIGEIISNAMSEQGTRIEKAENALSVMDKMSFSENGMALFISICLFEDDELKMGELADAIEKSKEEAWFTYDYIIIEIWNPQIGMVTSAEINLETMETRNCGWYDE